MEEELFDVALAAGAPSPATRVVVPPPPPAGPPSSISSGSNNDCTSTYFRADVIAAGMNVVRIAVADGETRQVAGCARGLWAVRVVLALGRGSAR